MHKDSVDEICDLWRTIIDQNIVLACFRENSNEIIGINLVAIVQQSDVEKAYVCCLCFTYDKIIDHNIGIRYIFF